MMSKNDFALVAKIVSEIPSKGFTIYDARKLLAFKLNEAFKREYPHFNSFKFLLNCGIEDENEK